MPLTDLAPDISARVMTVQGGRGIAARLASMGIYPGSIVTLKCGGSIGPVIIQVRGSRIAIGRGMAHRILVEPLN